jgi:Ca-activated chloride channel family protein
LSESAVLGLGLCLAIAPLACTSQKSTPPEHLAAAQPAALAEFSSAPAEMPVPPQQAETQFDTEGYRRIDENPFRLAAVAPRSTFSIDVDTASYANVRRLLEMGKLPPADAVRIEELLNYFPYDYAPPSGEAPFAVHADVFACPWQPEHQLVRVGLKAREMDARERPAANLVFLIDVSGSMGFPNKLPLVQRALGLLAQQLEARDRVALVVYAGASGVVLEPTRGDRGAEISAALDRLQAGGSTNGGAGIELAYALAQAGHGPGVASRVILATDGDFNVGITSEGELTRLIEEKAKAGVFLSVLGFGMGNYQDATLEQLADRGNGNYAYIDTLNEARKALVEQLAGTLITVAKDVKIQVEWNPARVSAYRLIGYENRALRDEDFLDDAKDAGEIGAGHSVTALFEIVAPGKALPGGRVEPLKYQTGRAPTDAAFGGELATVKLRWKAPDGSESQPLALAVADRVASLADAPADARFAAAVASFGMLLRDSEHRGDASFASVLALAEPALGADEQGYRTEFVGLVRRAQRLRAQRAALE